jgi:DNA-binding LacI/PurR family transcriptional regulator
MSRLVRAVRRLRYREFSTSQRLVNDELRNRVLNAMRELGYVPNSAARALRSRRTHIMGIVIPTLNHAIYAGSSKGCSRN